MAVCTASQPPLHGAFVCWATPRRLLAVDEKRTKNKIAHELMQLLLRGGANAEAWPTPRQLQIEQTGAGSTVKYHGMYGAKDAVAQLAGTLPQRAVVPCFVRGARLRVCVRVSALRVCSAWLSGKRDQTTFGPASAANSWPSARRSRGACAVWAMSHTRASRNLDFGFEVREAGACACGCARYIVFLYACFMCVY